MVTLPEIKSYLNIEDTTKDEFLKTAIAYGISELESKCNRKFLKATYTEIIYGNSFRNALYVQNAPVISITSLQYYDSSAYTNLFIAPDTIENTIEINGGLAYVRKNTYRLNNRDIKIVYVGGYRFDTGTGTITGTAGSNAITGVGTLFGTEVLVGDTLIINNEKRKVLSVTNATTLTLDGNLTAAITAGTFVITTVPEDIRKAVLNLAAQHFRESSLGNNVFFNSQVELNVGDATANAMREVDISSTVNYYRVNPI